MSTLRLVAVMRVDGGSQDFAQLVCIALAVLEPGGFGGPEVGQPVHGLELIEVVVLEHQPRPRSSAMTASMPVTVQPAIVFRAVPADGVPYR